MRGLPLRARLGAAIWFMGAVAGLSDEASVPTSSPAYDGLASGSYLFGSVEEDFDETVSRWLRDASYTLVFDRVSRSAKLYVHGSGLAQAVGPAPGFLLEQLESTLERGEDIDFSLAVAVKGSEDPRVRERLAEVLSESRSPTTSMVLADLLFDLDPSVAAAALDALVEQDTGDAVHVVGTALLLDGQTLPRHELAESLTEFETLLAETYLAQAQGDADPRVRKLVEEFFSAAN